jgi:hypothetical protein
LVLTATFFPCRAEPKPTKPGPLEAPLFVRAREVLKEEPRIVAGSVSSALGPPRNEGDELLWAIGDTRCFHKTIVPAGRPLSVNETRTVHELLAREEFRKVFAKYREINLFPPDASYQVLGIILPTESSESSAPGNTASGSTGPRQIQKASEWVMAAAGIKRQSQPPGTR